MGDIDIGSVVDQIGNAVARVVAQAMGLAMLSALKGWEIDWEALLGPEQEQSEIVR
ncbi:hypothetical protein [Rhizobium binxianense]|uniref:hypothetical protein n=1 Tax=Rhizobium binxianense TaxID=3024242 RepID=UPI002360AAE0|nr:hypothetical protein [Rhizobium sp. MJ37]MDC9837562.1 hypothetical protein [Rhizobium sp. MJ37]